jgi:transglutaminase-like putative cysteine protease
MGNIFLTIDFEGQNSSSLQYALFYVTVLQHFTAYAITYNVNPLKIGAYDNSSSLYKLYTSSVPYIQSNNPEIVAKAKEIAQGDTNPYRVAYKIHNWVYSHMTYDLAAVTPYSPATEGALFALHSGKGVCRHYAALFTALARADGIPTANLFGSALTDNGSVVDKGDSKHGWVQFFIPNYGWISDDPTWSEFARLDNNHAPMMATNYTYQVAWSPDPGVFDQVLNSNLDEPVISLGIQVAEFPVMAPLTLVLVMAVTLWSINSKRNLATRK